MKPLFTLFLLFALLPCSLMAWGPHSEITQAAVDTVPANDPLLTHLGPEARHLRDYCWMADWRRTLHKEESQWFYTDDYLLFPAMTMHSDHICPEVKQTYTPYFRRALQALRTETPANAVRWIGSLMHFTEDTGSPPHAAEIRGDVHSKMENWVDAKAITIAGYQPQLLGRTDDEAVTGFLKRMDGLIEFSKQRAERARPFVLSGDRPSTEPIVLESALEVSRVVADLLHTLGVLADQLPAQGASLSGSVSRVFAPGLEKMPAKVMILGTLYSTLSDAANRYQFKNLPPGSYTLAACRTGHSLETPAITLSKGAAVEQDLGIGFDVAAPINLVRNPSFSLHWLTPDRPDFWYPVKPRLVKPQWEGELIPLQPGKGYGLSVVWQKAAKGQVSVRLLTSAAFAKPATELKPLESGEPRQSFTATSETAYAQVVIHSEAQPSTVCRYVSLVPAR